MTKITTDFSGGESTAVVKSRLTSILQFWLGSTALTGVTTWGNIRSLLNGISNSANQILDQETYASFLGNLNFLNDLDQVIPGVIFSGSRQGIWFDPSDFGSMFQDTAATIPVTAPGQSVALIRDKSGRGNHATQATASKRPVLTRRPKTGRRNLLPATNNLAASGWIKIDCTVSGDKIIPNTNNSQKRVTTAHANVTLASNQAFTFAADFKADGLTTATVHIQGQSGSYRRAWAINLTNGTVSDTGGTTGSTNISQSITPLADGWYRVTLTGIPQSEAVTGAAVSVFVPQEPATVGDGVAGIRMRNENFVAGTTEGAFQTVTTVYDVTEPGVQDCYGLMFDGVDDFLQTGNIAWATDEVTVTAGLRKLSDAARGMVVELGPFVNQRNFQLNAPTPNLNDYGFFSAGTTVASFATAVSAPNTSVVTGQAKITTDILILRRNAAQTGTSAADQGAGSAYDTNPLYIGMRAGTSLPFSGILFGLTAVNAVLDATQLGMVELSTNFNTGGF